jgi:hypothetical protein
VNSCAVCGANLALVGRAHRCISREPSPNVASPNKLASVSKRKSGRGAYARNARWRDEHREQYNAGMRDLMRKRRAEKKAPPA